MAKQNKKSAAPLKFDKRLVLSQWFLSLFEVKSLEELAEGMKDTRLEGQPPLRSCLWSWQLIRRLNGCLLRWWSFDWFSWVDRDIRIMNIIMVGIIFISWQQEYVLLPFWKYGWNHNRVIINYTDSWTMADQKNWRSRRSGRPLSIGLFFYCYPSKKNHTKRK